MTATEEETTIVRTSTIMDGHSLADDWNTMKEISFYITHNKIQNPEIIVDQPHTEKFEKNLQQELKTLLQNNRIIDFVWHAYPQK